MSYLIARTDVDDFETWKRAFDDNTDARMEHGCRWFTVLRGVDDPSHVTVLMEFTTEASARSWIDYVDDEIDLEAAGMNDTVITVFDAIEESAQARPTA